MSVIEIQEIEVLMDTVGKISNSDFRLNDEVMNGYFRLLQLAHPCKLFCASSFHYARMKKLANPPDIKCNKKKVNIYDYDFIFFPIHLTNHWALLSVDINEKSINYYDSISKDNPSTLAVFKSYFDTKYPQQQWKVKNWRDIPQQKDGNSCGVLVCQFATLLAYGFTINNDIDFTEVNNAIVLSSFINIFYLIVERHPGDSMGNKFFNNKSKARSL